MTLCEVRMVSGMLSGVALKIQKSKDILERSQTWMQDLAAHMP